MRAIGTGFHTARKGLHRARSPLYFFSFSFFNGVIFTTFSAAGFALFMASSRAFLSSGVIVLSSSGLSVIQSSFFAPKPSTAYGRSAAAVGALSALSIGTAFIKGAAAPGSARRYPSPALRHHLRRFLFGGASAASTTRASCISFSAASSTVGNCKSSASMRSTIAAATTNRANHL
jgi:hypothetical protein